MPVRPFEAGWVLEVALLVLILGANILYYILHTRNRRGPREAILPSS